VFNVYTYDLPTTICKKYVYTDDLALANSGSDSKMIETILSSDVFQDYFRNWCLKLNTNKNYLQYIPSKHQTSKLRAER